MSIHNLTQEASERAMERGRLGEFSTEADDRAARANRYELSIHSQETAAPNEIRKQVTETLKNSDKQFDIFFADAIKRRDEALIGKLLLRALDIERHVRAEEASEA